MEQARHPSLTTNALIFGAASAVLLFAAVAALDRQAVSGIAHSASTLVFSQARHLVFSRSSLVLMGVVLLTMVELALLDWNKTTLFQIFVKRSVSARFDAASYLLEIVRLMSFMRVVFTFGIVLLGARLANAASSHLGWLRASLPADGPVAILFSAIVVYLIGSFVEYWLHRLLHWKFFWHLHRFHHSASELNLLTVYRNHPAEGFTALFSVLSATVIFKVPDSVLLVQYFWSRFATILAHSQLPWTFGWIGRWIVASPAVHQLHHSIEDKHRDMNFSPCPLWDHLFGTWYQGADRPSAYGISDQGFYERPMTQWVRDAVAFYRDGLAWLVGLARKAGAQTIDGT